jgi:hypothetical protein
MVVDNISIFFPTFLSTWHLAFILVRVFKAIVSPFGCSLLSISAFSAPLYNETDYFLCHRCFFLKLSIIRNDIISSSELEKKYLLKMFGEKNEKI